MLLLSVRRNLWNAHHCVDMISEYILFGIKIDILVPVESIDRYSLLLLKIALKCRNNYKSEQTKINRSFLFCKPVSLIKYQLWENRRDMCQFTFPRVNKTSRGISCAQSLHYSSAVWLTFTSWKIHEFHVSVSKSTELCALNMQTTQSKTVKVWKLNGN